MKKILSLILALTLSLSLASCACAPIADPAPETTVPTGTGHITQPSTEPITEPSTHPTTEPTTEPTTLPTEPEHIHDYTVTETVEANCTEDGYTTHTCDCGDTYADGIQEAPGHSFGDWATIREATKAESGEAQRTCSVCGAVETRTLPKLESDHTHSYTRTVTKDATCAASGATTYTCDCGDSYTESIPKTSHTYTDTVTAPTCAQQGFTTHTCSVCGYSHNDSYVAALGHAYTDAVTAPTCAAGGYTTHTCTVCGYSFVDSTTEPEAHSWDQWVTTMEPTTESEGAAQRFCVICGATETKTLDRLIDDHTHSYAETVTKEATCTQAGEKTFTCTCGSTYTESIPKTDHNFVEEVLAPTCSKQGYTTYTCTVCGDVYRDSYTTIIPHDYVLVSDTATCTEDGEKSYECSYCGNWTYEVSPATGHGETATVTEEVNCYNDGYTATYCTVCGMTLEYTVTETAPGSCDFSVTMPLDDASQALCDEGFTEWMPWIQSEDFDVQVCSRCGLIDLDTMTFRYSDYEAACIMLGYVNALREENGIFPLELKSSWISYTRSAVNNWMDTGFFHNPGIPNTYSGGWDGGYNIRHHFQKMCADQDFLDEILSYDNVYFVYVPGVPATRNNGIYFIAVFGW